MNHRIFLLILASLLVGCGAAEDLPKLGKVTGTIKLAGKPLAEASVYFWPVEGGKTSFGITDENGFYELKYNANNMGVQTGNCEVRISTLQEREKDLDGKVVKEFRKETVPLKYNEKTTLFVEVKSGNNTFDFDLLP